MDTTAKRHMGVGVTGDIKGVRVGELPGVPIRRREDQQGPLPLADGLPVELYLRRRDAWRALDRGIVAQDLLCRSRDERGVPLELSPVVRVAYEGQDAVPDEALPTLDTFLKQTKEARVFRRAQAVREVVKGQRLQTVSDTLHFRP